MYDLQTIENTREKDETMVADDDDEVIADEEEDEFAGEPPGFRIPVFHCSRSHPGSRIQASGPHAPCVHASCAAGTSVTLHVVILL